MTGPFIAEYVHDRFELLTVGSDRKGSEMNAFAIDVRVQSNTAGGEVQPASLTVITRAVCTRVTCKATCGCTPLCITQSPLACW